MKRLYAVILLIPMLALLVGAVRLPAVCGKAKEANCSSMGKATGHCRMAMKTKTCHKGQSRKNKDESGSCYVDCPLCCLATFSPFIRFEIGAPAAKIMYTVMRENILSDYFKRHWKPPATGSLS
jgi:hypothetical protein